MSEDENKTDEQPTPNTPSYLTPLQEATERLQKATEEARKEAERLEALRAEQILSGTAGARPNIEPPAVETPKDYAQKALAGRLE